MISSKNWPERKNKETEDEYISRIWFAGYEFYRTFACHHNAPVCSLCKALNYSNIPKVTKNGKLY